MQNLITYQEAKEMIERYRANRDSIETPDFKGSLCFSETFDASAFRLLIDQADCVQVRAYYGMKASKAICTIYVGIDSNGNELAGLLRGDGDVIVNNGNLCPPNCGTSSSF